MQTPKLGPHAFAFTRDRSAIKAERMVRNWDIVISNTFVKCVRKEEKMKEEWIVF